MPVSVRRKVLRSLVRGMYDLQQLRIQCGNRFVGNWKVTRGQAPGEKEATLDPEAKELLRVVRVHNQKIATAMAEGRMVTKEEDTLPSKITTLIWKHAKKSYKALAGTPFPKKETFEGDGVLTGYTELCLIKQYLELLKQENFHEKMILQEITGFPIYQEFLLKVPGCGPRMSGCIIAWLDIHTATTVSKLWKFTGLDVGPDGKGRNRSKEHMIKRPYLDKKGKEQLKDSITYDPFIKTKLVGVLASCFVKSNSPYRKFYDDHKHRMEGHAVYGTHNDKTKDPDYKPKDPNSPGRMLTSKGRRAKQANRIMIKRFLADLYVVWRKLEGLPTRLEYSEAKQAHKHTGWSSLEDGLGIDPEQIKPQPYEHLWVLEQEPVIVDASSDIADPTEIQETAEQADYDSDE